IDVAGNQITVLQPWSISPPTVQGDRIHHRGIADDTTVNIINASAYHNPFETTDVDGDGRTLPIDALKVISHLASLRDSASQRLDFPAVGIVEGHLYLDLNEDGFVSPIDALGVINELARRAREDTSGESLGGNTLDGNVSDGIAPGAELSFQTSPHKDRDQFFLRWSPDLF
ncbi:MAG: hypothetical protein AAFP69_13955, partial [Planctomycetota bacterium]